MLKKLMASLLKYAEISKSIDQLDQQMMKLQSQRDAHEQAVRGAIHMLESDARSAKSVAATKGTDDPLAQHQLQVATDARVILRAPEGEELSLLKEYGKTTLSEKSWAQAEKALKQVVAAERLKAVAKATAEKKAQADAKKAEKQAKEIAKKNAKLQEKLAKAGVTKKPAAKKTTTKKTSTKKPSAEATSKAESKPEATTETINTAAQQVATEPVPNAPEATA